MIEVGLEEAFAMLAAQIRPVDAVHDCALGAARGRVLARDLLAPADLPAQDLAAMDGYAVRSADLAGGPRVLPVTMRILAGHPAQEPLPAGACARIMTGAPLPEGSDAVVMMELVQAVAADRVLVPGPVPAGTHRRLRGEHVRSGEPVLAAGRRLRPADLALASALGHAQLPVLRSLRVGVLSTGDELRDPGSALPSGTVYDSNRPMLLGALGQAMFAAVDLGICTDAAAALQQKIAAAFDRDVDALLISGGAALGDADVVRVLGGVRFLPIQVRPGRGIAVAHLEQEGRRLLVLGLPGNAVAAYVLAHLLAFPLLGRMAGAAAGLPRPIALPAARALTARPGRIDYRRARVLRDAQGQCRVDPLPDQGSAMIRSVCEADAIVAVGPEPATPAGDPLPTYLLCGLESPDPY